MMWTATRPPRDAGRAVASWRAAIVGVVKPGRCAIIGFEIAGHRGDVLADQDALGRGRVEGEQDAVEAAIFLRLGERLDVIQVDDGA